MGDPPPPDRSVDWYLAVYCDQGCCPGTSARVRHPYHYCTSQGALANSEKSSTPSALHSSLSSLTSSHCLTEGIGHHPVVDPVVADVHMNVLSKVLLVYL